MYYIPTFIPNSTIEKRQKPFICNKVAGTGDDYINEMIQAQKHRFYLVHSTCGNESVGFLTIYHTVVMTRS